MVIGILIALIGSASIYANRAGRDSSRREEGLIPNPHWAFIKSAITQWRGDSAIALRDVGPASFEDDFLTRGTRAMTLPMTMRNAPRSPVIKNVVFIVLESTGTQFMELYGSPYPTTPCLKAEARHSLVFRNIYSNQGSTLHAMMTLLLSLYPGTGLETYVSTHPRLPGTSTAQVFHERGYRTAFMLGGKLDYRNSRHFFENRGFDLVNGFEDFQRRGIGSIVSAWGMDDPPLFDSAFQWIAQDPVRPFFIMLWTQQTHHPYTLAAYQEPHRFIADQSTEPRATSICI